MLRQAILETEALVMEPPRRTLEDEQRAGIEAGLASGKRRGYWEAQLEKLEGAGDGNHNRV